MPYLFAVEVRYENGKYILHNPSDLINNFPFLEGKVILGKFISTHRDGRIIRINKEFKCKLVRSGTVVVGEILEPNPIEALGLPLPSYFLIAGYRFEKDSDRGKVTFPIAENMLLKGSYTSYFEDEIKRILKEEEAGLILEGIIFHPRLEKHASNLKEALFSFEQENFAFTKTSCRKILEEIKRIVGEWKTVDRSESLCEKLKSVVGSLYSFASIGGPHEGITTKEETELILKNTTSLLFYINSLLRNQRAA
jgi:hypothetical protein